MNIPAFTIMDKHLSCQSVNFEIKGSRPTDIDIFDFGIEDAVEYWGAGNLLDEIGKEEAMAYFGLVEKD